VEGRMKNGWIKIHYNLLNWEWYDDINTKTLFLHLLLMANWKDKKWHGILIKRGSFVTSLGKLANQTGLSVQNVRTSLNKLKSTHEITSKTTNKYTYITINNFNDYQETTNKLTNNQQTTNKQLTTTEERKKDKNIKESIKENKKSNKLRFPKEDELTQADFEEVAKKYGVPISFVLNEWDSVVNYCYSKNKKYADFKRTLMNFVKKDAIERLDNAKKTNYKTAIDASGL
jgi:hypothetical protein